MEEEVEVLEEVVLGHGRPGGKGIVGWEVSWR